MKKDQRVDGNNETAPKKRMKTWKKVVLIILCLILAAGVFVTVWQWNNIKAVYYFMTVGSSEDIAREIENTKKSREEIVSEYIDGTVRDFTSEEEAKIISGEMTVEEATEIIREDYKNSKSNKSSKNDTKKNKEELDEFIADNIIQLYSYKAYYLGQLGQIEKSATADYRALPNKEKTLVGKQSIVDKYLGKVNGLLSECDGKVHAIMASLEKELGENGMDTAIVDKINSSYEEEKALKKAYYMSLLNE